MPDTITIPSSAAELEEMLGDPAAIKKLFAENKFGDFIKAYASSVNNRDESIGQQVREETQRVLAEWLKENRTDRANTPINLTPGDAPALGSGAQAHGLYNPKAMGAKLDKEFENAADYFSTVWHLNPQKNDASSDVYMKLAKVRNAWSSGVPSDGGFLIPERLRAELLRVAMETAIVRPRARVIPMDSLRVPFPMLDASTNVGSVFGGVVAYWTEEGAALTQSQASFGRVALEAKKLTAYTEVPNELLSDSIISFEAFINDIFPEALAWYEDLAFLTGTGVGEPLGFLNSNALVSVAKESGQAGGTIVWENVIKMYARMLPSSLNRAVWLVNNAGFVELATLALSVGTGGSAVWLTDAHGQPQLTLLGRPVILSEKLPAMGTVGDIAFVDFGYYLIGDRQTMSATSSSEYKFGNDVTAFRVIQRVDGRPWLQSAITPANNGPTLSPIVTIAARA